MDDAELMTIGRFARLTGLSIHALRHYDDVDLLTPAHTDPQTGYRRYVRDQIRLARLIRRLRWVDLPIEEIRLVLAGGDRAAAVLAEHRRRLDRGRALLAARIEDVDHLSEEGITMPTPLSGCRPVQLKIAVDDRAGAVEFYRAAFGFRYDVTRRTDDADHSSFVFGTYGRDDFFLLHLVDDPLDTDRPGSTTFGLLVDDVDARHAGALAAGGVEAVAPRDRQGMPRGSAVRDPSGNWIWLYQG